MNFDEAIRVHLLWKVNLAWLLEGERGLDLTMLADDNACELGRWIQNEGRTYSECPAYSELVREHADFHRVASHVARLVAADRREEAEQLMSNQGAFTQASDRIVKAIRTLSIQVKEGIGVIIS